MASFEKYKKNEARYIYSHGCRKSTPRDGHIVKSLTNGNYSFMEREFSYLDERLRELQCSNRKDVNVMAELVVTLPKTFKGDSRQFFGSVYNFAKLNYKEDNIIYAEVHVDEPKAEEHIHIGFIPTYYDRSKKKAIVSYDKCVYKNLDKFHPKLSQYLEKEFGYDVGVINGATKNGNKTIEQLKEETRIREEIERLKEEKKRIEIEREQALSLSDKVIVAKYKKENEELKKEGKYMLTYMKSIGVFDKFIEWYRKILGHKKDKEKTQKLL